MYYIFIYFRSILDDASDEDTDELSSSEDVFKGVNNSDSNSTSAYSFQEPLKNSEQ
jgi:hypothetical protein